MSGVPNLELLVGVPSGSPVVRDYLAGEDAAGAFYRGHFADLESYRAKAREVDGRFDRAARERAAGALVAGEGADPDRLERFVEESGYVVTTGQQPGLFGGPLYSVLKALSAARLAQALESATGRPVIPVFWVASEDHDWAEANHAHVIGVDNELHEVAVEAPDPERAPALHRVVPGAALPNALADFLEHLPTTDFSPPFAELLRAAYRDDATLPQAFHELLRGWLGRYGVHFTDAAHPVVKESSADLLLRELDDAEVHEGVLSGTASRLQAAGYDLQVPILDGGVNLFLEGPAGRERLYREDGAFRLRTSGTRLGAQEVRERLSDDPSSLSPNVLLRPAVESAVFPTLAYVAGPGELAYYAQLADYFDALDIRMPVIHPRHSATPVEGKIRKVLDKFGVDVDALDRPFHELAGDLAREDMPPEVARELGELRGTIGRTLGALQGHARSIDPTLKGPIQHARGQAFGAVDDLEKKIVQAIKRENEVALQQLSKAQLHLFPLGRPAERVQSPLYYLFRYGDAVLDELHERFAVNLR